MRAQLGKYWFAVRYSYWFVPALMLLAAVVLSAITFVIDVSIAQRWPEPLAVWGLNTPAGARAVLSTIAGSMITVAGVSFSILIAAVVFATGQLGPRLLTIFMGDTSNKVTLGTFIATFVYGLLVLRTVQDSGPGTGAAFVPHLGVLVALLMALASLAVLISFIHHVPRSISTAQVVAHIGKDLIERTAVLFPNRLGEHANEGEDLAGAVADLPQTAGSPVRATKHGYITHIDASGLLSEFTERGGMLRLHLRPGDFVSEGEKLATTFETDVDDDLRDAVRSAFAIDDERTNRQDFLFVVQQLVEIAIRAMSPGINDPVTAISCLDWLGSAAIQLGQREMPSPYRRDEDGELRIALPHLSYEEAVAAMFDTLRPHIAGDRSASLHAFATLKRVLREVAHPPYRTALLIQAAALNETTAQCLAIERDRVAAASAFAALRDEAGSAA